MHNLFCIFLDAQQPEKPEVVLTDRLFKWVQHLLNRMEVLSCKGCLANLQLSSGVLGHTGCTQPVLGAVPQRRNFVVFLCLRFQGGIRHRGPFYAKVNTLESDLTIRNLNHNLNHNF